MFVSEMARMGDECVNFIVALVFLSMTTSTTVVGAACKSAGRLVSAPLTSQVVSERVGILRWGGARLAESSLQSLQNPRALHVEIES